MVKLAKHRYRIPFQFTQDEVKILIDSGVNYEKRKRSRKSYDCVSHAGHNGMGGVFPKDVLVGRREALLMRNTLISGVRQ